MWILIPLLIILVLFELYALALQCRNGHSQWKELRHFRYAHRGYHDKPRIPENSMAAFRRALQNYYGAELDIHLMRDGNLAVIHDSSLRRTADADVEIEDLTAADLENYRLEGTDEKIPLFSEVLELFEGKTPLVVELKTARGNYNELTAAACALLDKYQVSYCIESFDPRCLMWLKKNRPDIVRGQLSFGFAKKTNGDMSIFRRFMLRNMLFNFLTRPDFIAYRLQDRDNLSVKLCRGIYKVQEINWTIKTKEEMAEAERHGNLVIFEQFDPRG
ncbi:MAG: glycerophosphodiester phosphodiesterase [Ruminococcaceae bacterium]|nr:glycerophosphodiester phosphodiesterase [Oscillospiraceae bacterium]